MKYLQLLGFFLTIVISLNGQKTYQDEKGNTHLWGNATLDQLKEEPYTKWFSKNYDTYSPQLSQEDSTCFEGLTITVYIGTWCGDTKFLVPKFIKEWDAMGLPDNDLEIVALHNKGDKCKQGPDHETDGENIHRVPTFVFKRDGSEIGRIVERTVYDLHIDMKAIANEMHYEQRYQGQQLLSEYFASYEGDSLLSDENLKMMARKVRRELSGGSELNTYGYVLKAQGLNEEARFTFLLNRLLFPYSPNVRDSYAEYLLDIGETEAAKLEYLEVIRLKGEDENATKQLSKIYALVK